MDGEEAEWLGLVQQYQNVVSTLRYTEVMGFIAFCCCTIAYTRGATGVSAGRALTSCLHQMAAQPWHDLGTLHSCAAAVLHREL